MSTGIVRGASLGWLVLMAGLLQPGFLQAQTSEERFSALEARLSRLERNLELLLQKVSSASQPITLEPVKVNSRLSKTSISPPIREFNFNLF